MKDVSYAQLPLHMREGIRGYYENGCPPGRFLNAILCNDLVGAASNADEINKYALFTWAWFLYNELPRDAWGSQENVDTWIASKREK